MVQCEWCGKSTQKVVKIRMGKQQFTVCEHCAASFKEHKCIDCGCQINLQTMDKGRCSKCAQVYNYRAEKDNQDELNSYPFQSDDKEMSAEEFDAWLQGRPTDTQKIR